MVIVSASRTKCLSATHEILSRLRTPQLSWEDIELDILEAGFIKQRAHEMESMRDFSNLDELYLRFYQSKIDQPATLDHIRNTIKKLFPDGKSGQVFCTFAVFQKHSGLGRAVVERYVTPL